MRTHLCKCRHHGGDLVIPCISLDNAIEEIRICRLGRGSKDARYKGVKFLNGRWILLEVVRSQRTKDACPRTVATVDHMLQYHADTHHVAVNLEQAIDGHLIEKAVGP